MCFGIVKFFSCFACFSSSTCNISMNFSRGSENLPICSRCNIFASLTELTVLVSGGMISRSGLSFINPVKAVIGAQFPRPWRFEWFQTLWMIGSTSCHCSGFIRNSKSKARQERSTFPQTGSTVPFT